MADNNAALGLAVLALGGSGGGGATHISDGTGNGSLKVGEIASNSGTNVLALGNAGTSGPTGKIIVDNSSANTLVVSKGGVKSSATNGSIIVNHTSNIMGAPEISGSHMIWLARYDGSAAPTFSGDNCLCAGLNPLPTGSNQVVIGKNNTQDTTVSHAFIIGNGTSTSNRSNALTVDWNGNLVCNNIPAPPASDGNYVLKCAIVSGVATYTWEAQA